MTRISLLLALAVAGCISSDREAEITHCNKNGYYATIPNLHVMCCSNVNGNDICLYPEEVTKHRRETGQ